MRRSFFIFASLVALTSAACSNKGTGGSGGSSGGHGNGGSGGTDHCECHKSSDCTNPDLPMCDDAACGSCVPGSPPCVPSCNSGQVCESGSCNDAYNLQFVGTKPNQAFGTSLCLSLEVRPRPSQPALEASQLVVSCALNGIPPGDGMMSIKKDTTEDNTFKICFDLAKFDKRYDDQVPLSCNAHTADSNTVADVLVSVDNFAPRAQLERMPAMGFKRNDIIDAYATVDELHPNGGIVMARLAGPGDPVPDLPPAEGWVTGSPDPNNARRWHFALDQRTTSLPTMSGNLSVYIYTKDQFGNATMVHPTDAPSLAKVSRDAWTGNIQGAMIAGIKGGTSGAGGKGAGLTNVPAVDKNGNVLVLLTAATGNLTFFDPAGHPSSFSINSSGDAVAPVVSAAGNYYIVNFDHFDLYHRDGPSLPRINTCATTKVNGVSQGISCPPVLATPGVQEMALFSTSSGTMADMGVDTPYTPPAMPACIAQQTTGVLGPVPGAANTSPAATKTSTGDSIAIIGGQSPATISTFRVGDDGFHALNTFTPPGFDSLRDVPFAIDHDIVYAAPRFRAQFEGFQYTDTFDSAPVERSFPLTDVTNDKIGPPIVSARAVLFPTDKGIRALPRYGPWSQTAILAGDQLFKAPVVAGEGDILYAISYAGVLYAFKYKETPAPVLETLFSLQVGGMGETFSASPALTCSGVLVIVAESGKTHGVIVDSRGLDPNAAWPKVLHDQYNTGNATTDVACH